MNYQLSVVIAIQQADENLSAIIEALQPDLFLNVEFLFCYPDQSLDIKAFIPAAVNVSSLAGESDALIPHLWRDGVNACRADIVAFTTAHCIPDKTWVKHALSLDMEKYVGVGGSIDQSAKSQRHDWAIYIQRYVNFSSAREKQDTTDVAADNAVYRKQDILNEKDLLKIGFWEPSFHRRFKADKKPLLFDPVLRMTHKNLYTKSEFFIQRYRHGMAFGQERSVRFSLLKRSVMMVLFPAIPLIFLRKLFNSTRRTDLLRTKFISSLSPLIYFLVGWALGEAKGYLKGELK